MNAGTVLQFLTRFFDVNKFEELEMDTDSLYLALTSKEREDCKQPETNAELEQLRSKMVPKVSLMHPEASSPECALTSTKNTTSENQEFSKESSDVQRCYVSVARRTAVMMLSRTCFNSVETASKKVC